MIGVIADDLTGAAELGAIGWRHGLRAEIIRSGKPNPASELVCVDTDSRTCEPKLAAKRAAAAAKMLQAAGAKWIYKKVDSVLRGQVTAEIEAVIKQLKLKRALLLPANPSLGRIIKNGEYFLRGKLLHKTEFARDPHFPRRTSNVLQLINASERFQIGLANHEQPLIQGSISIGDAESLAEIQRWTKTGDAETLPAGGADFFNALIQNAATFSSVKPTASKNLKTPRIKILPSKEFFIIGTATQSARKFVTAQRRQQVPVFALPQELAWGASFSEAAVGAVTRRVLQAFALNSRVILHIGLPFVRDEAVAEKLSNHVTLVASQVLRRLPIGQVFAEGGATAAQLVRQMNWPRLEIAAELAPGVATLSVNDNPKTFLTIKPGSYIWPKQYH